MNGTYQPQNANAVEKLHPGFTAVAGPYNVNHQDKGVAKSEKATCVRSWRDQKKKCAKARIVSHGPMAWIIRKAPMELYSIAPEIVSGKLGIKGGRAFGA